MVTSCPPGFVRVILVAAEVLSKGVENVRAITGVLLIPLNGRTALLFIRLFVRLNVFTTGGGSIVPPGPLDFLQEVRTDTKQKIKINR